MGTGATLDRSNFLADQKFFTRMAMVMTAIILLAFAQFSARGLADLPGAPVWVHLHGVAMVAWLVLLTGQNMLVESRNLALHRKLGWLALPVILAVLATGYIAGYMALRLDRVPFFFSDPFFLALTWVETTAFGVMVLWGITLRKQTQWHRRIMIGATFIALEPAFGRLLPMPFIGQQGEWIIMLIQLGFVAVLGRHDRKVLGQVHPATIITGVILVAIHVINQSLAILPAWQGYAQSIASAG